MANKIVLPKTFDDKNNKRPECKGKPKLSYSQYTSYKDPLYRDDYYVQYFSGIELPSGEFALFGSDCGNYVQDKGEGNTPIRVGSLSKEDTQILDTLDYPSNCVYEDEIIVDLGDFCLEGYTDRTWYKENNEIEIRDYKTLNLDKKKDFYASDDYGQTALYAHQKEKEGYTVTKSEVCGLGRKGSSLTGTGNFKMRLSGQVEIIPTPYTEERGKKIIADITKVVHQISDEYKVYQKYFAKN
jgi:hypothetical protein